MKVQILTTGKDNFAWLVGNTAKYQGEHSIRVSTQPYVILGDYDIGISFMHQHRVLPEQVNSHTWINFHPGPLPEYKGRNLCYHAIMNGEKEFGATIHYMDENFDTGDIIEVDRFEIKPWMTAHDISWQVMDYAEDLFEKYFPRILAGEKFERKPNVGGTYYQKLPIDDVVHISGNSKQWIRAKYYPPHYYPKIEIGGVMYKIVKDE